jgi:hypothetical protein
MSEPRSKSLFVHFENVYNKFNNSNNNYYIKTKDYVHLKSAFTDRTDLVEHDIY